MLIAGLEHHLLAARHGTRRRNEIRFECPTHPDRHPSADFNVHKAVWVCRVCHAGGGARDLARRLGLETTAPQTRAWRPHVPPAPRGVPRTAWRADWLATVERARRQDRRLAPHRDLFRIADWLRPRHQGVSDARRLASLLGPDDPGAWRLLTLAARVATVTSAIEAVLDEAVRHVA